MAVFRGETTEVNFVMQRGDSKTYTLHLTDSAGDQIAITNGDVVYFTAKQNLSSSEADIEIEVTTFSAGDAQIDLVPSDTDSLTPGTYLYDIQWNTGSDKYTVLKGKLKIEEDVTRE